MVPEARNVYRRKGRSAESAAPKSPGPWQGAFLMLALVGLVLFSTGAVRRGYDKKTVMRAGNRTMINEPIIPRLQQADPENDRQIAALARESIRSSRHTAEDAVALWKGGDKVMSDKAELFLGYSEETAILPLVEAPTPPRPEDRVWMIQTVVAQELALRARVAVRLGRLLDDKTPVPIFAPPQRIEGGTIPRRVCDEAYMQLRLLLNAGESREQYYDNMDVFLTLPEAEKNAAIQKSRHSPPVWTTFAKGE